MKKNWIETFFQIFKRKNYLSHLEYNNIDFTKSSLIEIAKQVIEEEHKTKEITSKLKRKLESLENKELI